MPSYESKHTGYCPLYIQKFMLPTFQKNSKTRIVLLIVAICFALTGGAWLVFGYFGVQALFTERVVNDELPVISSAPVTTSSTAPVSPPPLSATGTFEQGDSTYTIKGTASVLQRENELVLTLSDFSVTNGPDLYVYLLQASTTNNTVVKDVVNGGAFYEVAQLKGNRGNQVYTLPPETFIDDQTVVSIWCKRFSRNFGSAKLEKQ